MLRAPDKRLRYSKQHFQGYYLQLHAYLRKDSDTDDYLDGIFTNPITDLIEGHARELKKSADHRNAAIMTVVTQLTSLYQEFQVAGGFPPTAEMLKENPIQVIKDLLRVTQKGTNAATEGNERTEATQWIQHNKDNILKARTGFLPW